MERLGDSFPPLASISFTVIGPGQPLPAQGPVTAFPQDYENVLGGIFGAAWCLTKDSQRCLRVEQIAPIVGAGWSLPANITFSCLECMFGSCIIASPSGIRSQR